MKDIENLSEIAQEEPQIAFSAFTKGLSHRWSYVQRTIGGISKLFQPLEDAIRGQLIPAILGHQINDEERDMLALPLRYGGLGMQNPVQTSDREYDASKKITDQLTGLIYHQDQDLSKLDRRQLVKKKELKTQKEDRFSSEKIKLEKTLTSESRKKAFCLASQKGSSSWLSALPLKTIGFCLNKIL